MGVFKHGECRRIKHSNRRVVSKLYRCWRHMYQRCANKRNPDYIWYGARGIKVCKRWRDYLNFKKDMGEPPTSRHSLDRIDNAKGYNKTNCRWATDVEQANNKRNNRYIKYKGKIKTLSEWARTLGIGYTTIQRRLNALGWSVTQAFSRDLVDVNTYLTYKGQRKTLRSWSKITGIPAGCLQQRLRKLNWSVEKTITTPVRCK